MRPPFASASFVVALAVVAFDGHVYDRTTGQPLAHVRVNVGRAKATTDSRGYYVLHGVRPGAATVTLESADVPAQHFSVHVAGGGNHIELRACSTTLDYNCAAPVPDFGHGNG